MLYHHYQDMAEGELTRIRAALVCEDSLVIIARRLRLGAFIRMGNGEARHGGRERTSILANAVEALLGAIYLDGGMAEVQHVISRWFTTLLDKVTGSGKDAKTMLQEHVQSYSNETAVYDIIEESGPPHSRSFIATVAHEGKILATGTGRTKKEAHQSAAKTALMSLGVKI
jgi:ribonuclease-3